MPLLQLPPDEDNRLVAGIIRKDSAVLEQFDARYRGSLRELARAAGVVDESDDIAQETLIAAVKTIQSGLYHATGTLRTFLISIIRRRIQDHWRRQGKLPTIRADRSSADLNETSLDRLPGRDTMDVEARLIVVEVLQSLSPERRTVLLMQVIYGLTVDEIALLARRPRGTIGRWLTEAKKFLRDRLA